MAKILVVEDQVDLASFTENLLSKAGHVTHWTDASEVALNYLRTGSPDQRPFDLVVLDIVYLRRKSDGPALTPEGLRLLRLIRKVPHLAGIPVIGTTTFLPEDCCETWRQLFMIAGGNAFFEYYYNPDEFLLTVANLLDPGNRRHHD